MMDAFEKIFLSVRDIPYRIPLSITEKNDACLGKHFIIKDALEELGYEVRWAECQFLWEALPIPKEILAIAHRDPAYHVWLEVKIDNEWQVIDATWDEGLKNALPVNEWKDFGKMKPAVPVLEMVPYDQIVITREPPIDYGPELQIMKPFFEALNLWFESVRNVH